MARQIAANIARQTEGWEGRVMFAYDDAFYPPRPAKPGDVIKGTLTAGSGHTGFDVYAGMVVTDAMVDRWFAHDTALAAAAVEKYVTVPLNDNQFGALVDWTYNAGRGALASSTLLRKLNAGDYASVPAELKRWVYTTVDGRKVISNGLKARRAHEAMLWIAPAAANNNIPPTPGATQVGTTTPKVKPGEQVAGGAVVAGGAAAIAAGVPWPYVLAVAIGAAIAVVILIRSRKP